MNEDREKDLPWLVNGSEDWSQDIHDLAESDENIKNELAFMNSLRETIQNEQVATPGEFGLSRLKRDVADEKKQAGTAFSGFGRWARPALAAALVVVVLQSALLVDQSNQIDEAYQQLSGESPTTQTDDRPLIQVSFSDNTTEKQMRQAIQSINATIVSGPSDIGAYTLALPSEANLENALAYLQAQTFVENAVEN